MFSKSLSSTVAAALVASSLVSAQTKSECDPREKSGCPANPALGTSVTCDFTQGECDAFKPLAGTTLRYDGSKGAVFSIDKPLQGPTLISNKYMFFGKVEVELQCAASVGLISSIVLESDALDEIDWEWLGSKSTQVQSNYFRGGDDETYDRGGIHDIANAATTLHKYSLEWTKDKMEWSIDGKVIRTQTAAAAKGKFPQSPMRVRLGTWATHKETAEGTKAWAGGETQFDQGPFEAFYKSASVVDYAGGDKPAQGNIKEYVYGDKTASRESIKIIKGDNTESKPEADKVPTSAGSSGSATSSRRESVSATSPISSAPGSSSVNVKAPQTTANAAASGLPAGRTSSKTGVTNGTSIPTASVPSSFARREVVSLSSLAVAGVLAAAAHLLL